MSRYLAVMLTCTTYGTWLRGDSRGYVDDGKVLPPNPALHASDTARLKHPPYTFPTDRLLDTAQAIGQSLIERKQQRIFALTLQIHHLHILLEASDIPIPDLAKCLKDAARYHLNPGRPIWTTKYDKRYCFDQKTVMGRKQYIEKHNLQNHWPAQPFDFLSPPN